MAETADRPYDRRRAPRITVKFPVTIAWGKKKFSCHAEEFSEFGILVAPKHKELVGQEVELNLALDTPKETFAIKGIVAYATDAGLGVRFKDVTEEQQASLKDFLFTHDHRN
jgi:hypothetical protein